MAGGRMKSAPRRGSAGTHRVAPLLAFGMVSVWPTGSLRSSWMLLALRSSATVTWYFDAIEERVSPWVTTWEISWCEGATGLVVTDLAGTVFVGSVFCGAA